MPRAVAIHVYITNKEDGEFSGVEHIFYGRTEAEADKIRLAHLAGCENYGKAEATEHAFEEIEDIDADDIPQAEDFADEEPVIDVPGKEVPAVDDEEDDEEEE